ncbi:hypothetical protein M569_12265 [Genlisea aurea]|uniref:Uncharacterized protein n=1 Tax=Genlisea aurea TaxID=192259 RepID=S8C6X1_9LAMI|nr:hypothetical protein M569_12265 [Genlisea aurea]
MPDFKTMYTTTQEEKRRRARIERHQRTQQRAAKALGEKNQRDLQVQKVGSFIGDSFT